MNFEVSLDIQTVLTLLGISGSRLADELHVARSTVNRILKKEVSPSDLFLETFYSFAYENHIRDLRLNELKSQFASDQFGRILFHGARNPLDGEIDLNHSRKDIDVGKGFYLGESFSQASSYIFANKKSSVYVFDVRRLSGLKTKEFGVDLEWMLMVAYYREQLKDYENSPLVQRIIKEVEESDVVIAPIADNDMYETMGRFARGELTDQQATVALSASNLGKQHVLKSDLACRSVSIVDRLYLCGKEREHIAQERKGIAESARDKAKIAIERLRRNGKYIEEILKP